MKIKVMTWNNVMKVEGAEKECVVLDEVREIHYHNRREFFNHINGEKVIKDAFAWKLEKGEFVAHFGCFDDSKTTIIMEVLRDTEDGGYTHYFPVSKEILIDLKVD